MNPTLRIFFIVCIVLFFLIILYYLIKKKLNLKYTLIWLFSVLVLLILAIFPILVEKVASLVGIVDIPTHVYEGYKYCMEKGWDEAARVCMTHSYRLMKDEFDYEPSTDAEKAIKEYILHTEADDYDKLIQLCDSLATDYGFVILEKRFVDVTRRYGIMEGYIKGWDVSFEIKETFEEKMGCSIYDVLPDIGRTTLLSPKPWTPERKR